MLTQKAGPGSRAPPGCALLGLQEIDIGRLMRPIRIRYTHAIV
jgi:hypothetical protein